MKNPVYVARIKAVSCFFFLNSGWGRHLLFAAIMTLALPLWLAAQAPNISYTTPLVLQRNVAAVITPTNSGGSVQPGSSGNRYRYVGNFISTGLDRPAGVCMDAAGNVYLADTYNHVIKKVTSSGTVSIIAGVSGSAGVTEGAALNAKFRYPSDVALSADETILYICDKENHGIRALNLSTAQVSTIAGSLNTAGDAGGNGTSARFRQPQGIVMSTDGNAIFVTDLGNEKIKKIELSGSYSVTHIAGAGTAGGTNNTTGVSATFNGPQGITADANFLYVTEFVGHRIRKISLTSPYAVTTLAGTGSSGAVNATGTSASFNQPKGITIDGAGNLYVADQGNDRIRKITSAGVVTTLAGSGISGATAGDSTAASFSGPADLFMNETGLMYVADQTGSKIRKIEMSAYVLSGTLPTGLSMNPGTGVISGTPTVRTSASSYTVTAYNYDGSAQSSISIEVADLPTLTTTTANTITASTAVAGGEITADGGNAVIARGVVWSTTISPTVALTTKTTNGTGTGSFSGNLTGLSPSTNYYYRAYATNGAGTAYGPESTLTTLQMAPSISFPVANITLNAGSAMTPMTISNTGGTPDKIQVSTLAGGVNGNLDGVGTGAKFSNPSEIAIDNSGNLYFSDVYNHNIRKISQGVVTTFAGSTFGYANGTGTEAKFNNPHGIVIDSIGNLYVSDRSNHCIRKITPAGVVTTLAGSTAGYADGTGVTAKFNAPSGLAIDSAGNIYVADKYNNRIRKVTPEGVVTTVAGIASSGRTDGFITTASFSWPEDVALDRRGNIFVTDRNNHRIRKITRTGTVSTFAGSTWGYVDAIGASAKFNTPIGICIDADDNLYVADISNILIRKITSDSVVSTFAGGGTSSSYDGVGTSARFGLPTQIAIDPQKNLFISDESRRSIRTIASYRIEPTLPDGLFFDATTGTISGTPAVPIASRPYTVYAQNSAGSVSTTIEIAIAAAPSVTTQAATGITSSAFTLNALVNPNGSATSTITIKYSTSLSEISAGNGTTASISPTSVSGNTNTPISATVTGLSAATTYYFRISATNIAGTSNGSILLATTAPRAPVIGYPAAASGLSFTLGTPVTLVLANSGGIPEPMQVSSIFKQTTELMSHLSSVVMDNADNLYFCSMTSHKIFKFSLATQTLSVLSGTGTAGLVDGSAVTAQFNNPVGLALDGAGNLYVADRFNHSIRKIDLSTLQVSTIAGSGVKGFADGTGTSAKFNIPTQLAFVAGDLYISDNANGRIRKLNLASGLVSTPFGDGLPGVSSDGFGNLAKLNAPNGIFYAGNGILYFTEGNAGTIRKINLSTSELRTIAGNINASGYYVTGSSDGNGFNAGFNCPNGFGLGLNGELFIADQANNRIRKMDTSTVAVTTMAGSRVGYLMGTGTSASFSAPAGPIAVDTAGNLYFAAKDNVAILKLSKFSISPALPAGLSFNTGNGTITGTPTAVSTSTTYTITASNTGGNATTTVSLAVNSSLMTADVSAINETSASCGGTVDSSFSDVTARGVVWSTATSPTVALSTKTSNGTGTGTFTSAITGLSPNTIYYVRAYAVHRSGTDYGVEKTFKTNQLGTFADITKTYGDPSFIVYAPSSISTGGFTYTSSNTAVGSLSDNEVTIEGPGTTTITATQDAAGAFAAVSKSLTLTVGKATPVITFNIPNSTTLNNASNMPITATASNGAPVTISIGSSTATGTLSGSPGSYLLNSVSSTGTLVFNASVPATSTHEAASSSVSMDVTKNNQTITFGSLSPVTYTPGLTQTLTATTSAAGLTVAYTVVIGPATVSGNTLRINGTGAIVVVATQPGNSTYNEAPGVAQTLMVNPGVPDITGFTPTSATSGDTIIISGNNFQNVSSVSFGGTSARSYVTIDSATIRAVLNAGHTGAVTVATTAGRDSLSGFRYKVTWTGATTTFNNTGNWSGGRIPQTDDDIIFSPTAASDLDLDGHKTVGNVDFNGSGRSLKLGAYNLTVNGNLSMPGNITGSGRVILAGSAAQTIRGGGDIPDLEINNSNGVTIDAAGDVLTVSGTLRSTSGTLTTNGKLRLTSNSSSTARVGVVTGAITGNVIAERYVKRNENSDGTGRAWRLVSLPVTGTGTLRDFFMNGRNGQDLTLTDSRDAETENSGTPIVGHNYATAAEATTAGFDWIGVANSVSSLRSYVGDAGGGSFASEHVPSLSTTYAAANQGYMVFTRGDRKLDFPNTTSSGSTTFRSTGSLKTGLQLVSVATPATSKYTLVGNPYMSVLSLDALYTTNSAVINPSFWIWDANISGSNKQGGYVNVYKSGTQWVTNTGSYVNPELLESGMAFFVEPVSSLSSATNISILESHKSSAVAAGISPFSMDKPDDHGRMYVRLERADAKGQRQIIDGVMADFHTAHKVALTDMSDREKLRNGISRGALWIPREGKTLSGEGLPWPTDVKRSIPLYMSGVWDQTLLVHINPTGMRDRYVAAWLKDNVLKREVEINMSQPFDYDFIGTGRADWDSTRFEIVYVEAGRPGSGVTLEPDDAAEQPSIKLYPNPAKTAEVKLSLRAMAPGSYTVQVLDMTGRLVSTSTLEHRSVNGEYRVLQYRMLSPGKYLLRLSTEGRLVQTLRLIHE